MKRILDIIAAAIGLVVLSPLLLLIAAAIKFATPGRIFFTQERIGRDRKPFKVIKFRTMAERAHIDQYAEAVVEGGADPRITKLGRWLRASSIDEVPQLINVLKGQMSLVGPRPILPEQLKVVPESLMGRFDVSPGITGLAQVSGRRSLGWMDQLKYDQAYAQIHSLRRDLRILLRTLVVVLTGSGLYADSSKNWRAYLPNSSNETNETETRPMPPMTLMLMTNNVQLAERAGAAGVERLFVDMETIGKEERQGHLDTHRASHTPQDVCTLRNALPSATIMVRINPLHEGSAKEIDAVISAGADFVMLPMFTTDDEVKTFLDLVDGRAQTTLLLETPQALTRIDRILEHRDRIDEIHVGLNDLHLGMGLAFMFELLEGGLIDYLGAKIQASGIRFGFGGIARIGGDDTVPAELLVSEHVRLGSEMIILSRSFHHTSTLAAPLDLAEEVQKLRSCELRYRNATADELEANRVRLRQSVRSFVQQRQSATGRTAAP